MCGIPMAPRADATRGKRLTWDEALAHVESAGGLVSAEERRLIHGMMPQYLWRYRDGTTRCTACGHAFEGFQGAHGRRYACPVCGAEATLRHEARGHTRLLDQIYLYQWRKSGIDRECVTLTGIYACRDSTKERPHLAAVRIAPCALYVFRPGRAVTVYKSYTGWMDGKERWQRMNEVCPDHTKWYSGCGVYMDVPEMWRALEGTRIGATFRLMGGERLPWDRLPLDEIANCARRPWLEYLYKAGQRNLAELLMRMPRLPRAMGIREAARTPRELLGLTEHQWQVIRRDGIELDDDDLLALHGIQRLMGAAVEIDWMRAWRRGQRYDWAAKLRRLLKADAPGRSVRERIEGLPGKLRRRIARRVLSELPLGRDWEDYYDQMAKLGEDMTDAALMLPRDIVEAHDRMTRRVNLLRTAREIEAKSVLDGDIVRRADALRARYAYHAAGLVLRPYESAREIIEDGSRLCICIGDYVERYAEGQTVICCLRREDEPDEPWRAVQFWRNGRLAQDRGAHNDSPRYGGIAPGDRRQLRAFWAAFERREAARRERRTSA